MKNRQIKFRVYHPDLGKLVYWRLEDGFNYSDRYLSQHKYPVQQSTGVKDKNGREIYEGDIHKNDFGVPIGMLLGLILALEVLSRMALGCGLCRVLGFCKPKWRPK